MRSCWFSHHQDISCTICYLYKHKGGEVYGCTKTEENALRSKLQYNGMTIMLSYVLYKVNQKWADTLNNNTEVLHKLCDKIDNIKMWERIIYVINRTNNTIKSNGF